MTRKTMDELKDQMEALLPDNSAEQISAEDFRVVIGDFLDTMTPAYAYFNLDAPATILALDATPVVFDIWDNVLFESSDVYDADLADGSCTMVQSTISRVSMILDLEGATQDEISAALYINDVPTSFIVEVVAQGIGNSAQLIFSAIMPAETIGDKLQMYVARPEGQGPNSDILFNHGYMIFENLPIIETGVF